jgi:hypothetical protein
VFTHFPTLLLLIKKRAAPDTLGLAISVIYYIDSISSMIETQGNPRVQRLRIPPLFSFLAYVEGGGGLQEVGFFIKVRFLARTFLGHGVQQYFHKTVDRGGAL